MDWRRIREQQEEGVLSQFASRSVDSRGREHDEPQCPVRPIYERDANRIQYSSQFRRLRHKTQVFFNTKNDHVCTRMEHVLNVGAISETLSKVLGLNADLTRAIALGHDIGHAPFGHTGERVLNECLKKYGSSIKFRHEEQSLRVVERLAVKSGNQPNVCGLNLSYEVRDGIVCHCGEIRDEYRIMRDTSKQIDSLKDSDIEMQKPFTLEGCLVRLVDKIAYVGRDIEDAVRVGLINVADISSNVRDVLGSTNGEIINTLVRDLLENSYGRDIIALSDEKGQALAEMIGENYKKIYDAPQIRRYERTTTNIVEGLFEVLIEQAKHIDLEAMEKSGSELIGMFARFIEEKNYTPDDLPERIVIDYISGMTDVFAIRTFESVYWL